MVALLRKIGNAVLWLVGGGIQGINWLWTALFGIGLTAAFGVVVSYLRDMPSPLFWLLVVVVFIVIFAILNHIVARPRQQERAGILTTQPQIAINNFGQLNINNVAEAGQAKDIAQDRGPKLQPNEVAEKCIRDRTLRIVDLVGDGAHMVVPHSTVDE